MKNRAKLDVANLFSMLMCKHVCLCTANQCSSDDVFGFGVNASHDQKALKKKTLSYLLMVIVIMVINNTFTLVSIKQ